MNAIVFIKNVLAVVVGVDHLVHYCALALDLCHRIVFAHDNLLESIRTMQDPDAPDFIFTECGLLFRWLIFENVDEITYA